MAGTLYWQGMMQRVQDFVKACDTCQRQKYAATTPNGLLQPLPIPVLGETRVEAVAQELRDKDEALRQLKTNLLKSQEHMKYQADKRRKEVKFEVGNWVFLKLRPHRKHSVVQRIHKKLAPRFFGPYQIMKKIGQVAYKLKLPPTSKIHPTFHVSQLKKAEGNYTTTTTTQLPISLESEKGDITSAKILSWRDKFDGGHHKREWLIQWEGMDVEDATWEEELLLKSKFPDLHLEVKANVVGGGDDRNESDPTSDDGDVLVNKDNFGPKQWRVYVRKNKKGPVNQYSPNK
ncbi:hypothetical protein KIW84_044368 [Lathyrus oleraceus]|uniref:Chromo domain-containing protein n=1 Tax=Pisum sativum TaxID=3888 RepID=A0A9D4XK28_PEA|nr:hypothetical protein KIW84_044368 [Pisum sativum]